MVVEPIVAIAAEPMQSTSDAEAPPCKELLLFLQMKRQIVSREILIKKSK